MATGRVVVFVLFIAMSCCAEVPKKRLNNGREMPTLALGTYLGFDQNGIVKSKNKGLRDAVSKAIEVGWRHFDTATVYTTEDEVGEAVRGKIEEGTVKREDIFITTKLWNTHHERARVAEALRESLALMGLNYVDLYLVHWPIGLNQDHSFSEVDYMETWRGMEDMVRLGLARSIGLSNFNRDQIQRVLDEGTIKPAALQIEVHPQIVQSELVSYAQSKDIVVMAYSPLGSLVMRYGMQFPGPKLDEPALVEIAKKYNKTTPQVVIRWLLDRNIVPVVKTSNPKRLIENIDVFDFELTKAEIEKVSSYDTNTRYTVPSFWQKHPYYPFEKVDIPIQEDPFAKKKDGGEKKVLESI